MKLRWDTERPLRLAGEAVIGRLGDIATKLPDEVTKATPEIPRVDDLRDMRVLLAVSVVHPGRPAEGGDGLGLTRQPAAGQVR